MGKQLHIGWWGDGRGGTRWDRKYRYNWFYANQTKLLRCFVRWFKCKSWRCDCVLDIYVCVSAIVCLVGSFNHWGWNHETGIIRSIDWSSLATFKMICNCKKRLKIFDKYIFAHILIFIIGFAAKWYDKRVRKTLINSLLLMELGHRYFRFDFFFLAGTSDINISVCFPINWRCQRLTLFVCQWRSTLKVYRIAAVHSKHIAGEPGIWRSSESFFFVPLVGWCQMKELQLLTVLPEAYGGFSVGSSQRFVRWTRVSSFRLKWDAGGSGWETMRLIWPSRSGMWEYGVLLSLGSPMLGYGAEAYGCTCSFGACWGSWMMFTLFMIRMNSCQKYIDGLTYESFIVRLLEVKGQRQIFWFKICALFDVSDCFLFELAVGQIFQSLNVIFSFPRPWNSQPEKKCIYRAMWIS